MILIVLISIDANRLSPALVRPGRVDLKIKLDYATRTQIEGMCCRFYERKASSSIISHLLEKVGDAKITPAQLQVL